MNRLNKTESVVSNIVRSLYFSKTRFPDYLEVATVVVVLCGVGKTSPLHRYSVDMFSYSGPSGILGSDG